MLSAIVWLDELHLACKIRSLPTVSGHQLDRLHVAVSPVIGETSSAVADGGEKRATIVSPGVIVEVELQLRCRMESTVFPSQQLGPIDQPVTDIELHVHFVICIRLLRGAVSDCARSSGTKFTANTRTRVRMPNFS
ncbi:hypothetical protein MJD09_06685 [bacterium]|nr:hypothetical protein [bacterium]